MQGRRERLFFQSNTMLWGSSVPSDLRRSSAWQATEQRPKMARSKPFSKGKSQPSSDADGGRVAGKPLPRLPLNISNQRPQSAWNANHGRMASMILSGGARAANAALGRHGANQQLGDGEIAVATSYDDRQQSLTTLSAVGEFRAAREAFETTAAAAAGADDDDGQMKTVGTQCDLMSEVVLKFNKNTLLGAVELSRLDDILRRFAAVAHPLVGAESKSLQLDPIGSVPSSSGGPFAAGRVLSDSDASSTAQRSTLLGSYSLKNSGTAASYSAAATRTAVYADSITESSVGYAASEPGALSPLYEALDWPDGVRQLPLAGPGAAAAQEPDSAGPAGYSAHSAGKAEADGSDSRRAAAEADGQRPRNRLPDVPPVDYQLETVPASAARAAATQTRDITETRARLLNALKERSRQAGGGGGSHEAISGLTAVAKEAGEAAAAAAPTTATAISSPSQSEASSERATAVWHERLMAGVGLGYRMPWRHAGEASNIVIPRPRVVPETMSASPVTTEGSTTPENEDADVIDIRL